MSEDNQENTPKIPQVRAVPIMKKSKDAFVSGLLNGPGMSTQGNENGQVTGSNALEYEDDFKGLYGGSSPGTPIIIQPPFNPLTLEKLVSKNNTLAPCIDAMVANVDGTGHEVIDRNKIDKHKGKPTDEEETEEDEVDPKLKELEDFFAQPWPGQSFTTIRKSLRRDLEVIGYGFLEIIRNPKGEVVFIRHIDAKTMRLVKLDGDKVVQRSLQRGGKKVTTTVRLRFRRFAQKVGQNVVYFKEFKADPDLHRDTGEWAEDGTLKFRDRANEIIYFTMKKDINTPYGVPRWIPQTPSVVGSRFAEENNVEFFETGGVPPFMILVQGGMLATETKDAIENGLSLNSSAKQRGLIIEAHSTSGSLDDSGAKVDVKVERFGGEKQNDSQFEGYDDKCSNRVRRAFRLPPVFIGESSEYNFASMFASYMVGEAQIFKPERDEFDEVITLKLIPELLKSDDHRYVFRSLPIVVNDAKEKVMALKLASDKKAIGSVELVRNLNEVTGLEMIPAEDTELQEPPGPDGSEGNQEGITSDSSLTDASTSAPNEPQGTTDVTGKTYIEDQYRKSREELY